MAEQQRQDRTLSELVVRGAVEKGMDSPLRETIVEVVEESEGAPSSVRRLPLAGGLLGLGVAVGYLLGAREEPLGSSDLPIEPIEESEPVEDLLPDEEAETMTDADAASGGGWGRRILVGLGFVAAVAIARRLRSGEQEEWEPIEEFETAVQPETETESSESSSETGETDEQADDATEVESDEDEQAANELEEEEE